MTRLHDRFHGIDQVPSPDLWAEVTQRAAAPQVDRRGWTFASLTTAVPMAVAATVLLAALIGVGLFLRPNVGLPSVPVNTPSGSAPVIDQAPAGVKGWPGAREEPAGRYSWDMTGDGWMHNVTDPRGGLEMRFSISRIPPTPGDTTVTIAGYTGTFEEDSGGLHRVWVADMAGTIVRISATAEEGTPPEIRAQAEAIVGSIRHQRDAQDNEILTFTLPAGWDSG